MAMLRAYKCVVLSALVSTIHASIGPVADLVIANKQISPDGVSRSAVLAGGTFPGPIIRGEKGSRFQLNVIDSLTDKTMIRSTSVHWHGIFQDGSSWADGTSFVTQCPIAANDSFLYDFSVKQQAGTFWYHSHLSTQYCDGLRGAFILHDPQDPHKRLYDVDDDSTVITLSDWYHKPALMYAGGLPPTPDSTLINGLGRYPGGQASPLAVINVVQGKRYRLRILGTACDPNFAFSIDNHNLTVIETDGQNTQPYVADQITVYPGQRYSAVLIADQPVGNYWVRAEPNVNHGPVGFDGGINSAILRYAGASSVDPTTTRVVTKPLNEAELRPLVTTPAPGEPSRGGADVNINLVTQLNVEKLRYEVNGHTFVPPTVPVLLQILSGAQTAQDLLPAGSVYPLPKNKVIEISLPGTGLDQGGPHPWHLHGHEFAVVRSADSETYNWENPVRRDTVSTGLQDSNTTIRFVTDNDGPWFLHCHVDWHLDLGMAVVLAEDIPDIAHHSMTPEAWDQLCPKYNALPPDQLP